MQQEVFHRQIGFGQASEGCALGAAGDEQPLAVGTEPQMHEVVERGLFELRGNCFARGCIPNLDDAFCSAGGDTMAIGAEPRFFQASAVTEG